MGGRPLWEQLRLLHSVARRKGGKPEKERERVRSVPAVIDGAASCPVGGY